MNSIDDKYIESYLEGNLTAEEQEEFEEMMNKNQSLKKEVELHREINDKIKYLSEEEDNIALFSQLDEELKSVKSEEEYIKEAERMLANPTPIISTTSKKKVRLLIYKFGLVAACIGVLIFVIITLDKESHQYTNEEILAQHYKLPDIESLLSIPRSTGTEISDLRSKAEEKLKTQDFASSAELWTQIVTEDTLDSDIEAKFFKGFSLLHANELREAQSTLKMITKDPNLGTLAQWYLMKSYLITGENDELGDLLCDYAPSKKGVNKFKGDESILIKEKLRINCK